MNKWKFKTGIILSSLLAFTTISAIALYTTSCSTINKSDIDIDNTTHISNETQQYSNDNSISLGFEFQPDYGYAADRLEEFFMNDNSLFSDTIENDIVKNIREQAPNILETSNLLFGTSWIIDYKLNTSNYKNTYYLATNAHVLDLSYVIKISELNLEFTFPINSSSVNFLNLYLSQPQGDSELNLPFNASYRKFDTDWYKTNINESNINSSIIQYANNSSSTFDFSIFYTTPNFNENSTILVNSNNKTSNINEQINASNNNMGIDSSILKLELNPNTINNNSSEIASRKQIRKLRKIFDADKNYENKTSNYISKLKDTYLKLQAKEINSYKESESFPFELGNDFVNELTVGGFPGNNKMGYTYFNTGTTSDIVYNTDVRRDYIRFLNGNSLSYIKYDSNDTSLLGGINLMPGSSGSMVLNNKNKIVGIYWGAFTSGEYGLFIPFEYKNNLLFTRLINFIKSSTEFQGSALRNIFDYQ